MFFVSPRFSFFFFNDTATTEIYTLSLHDALPICPDGQTFVTGYRQLGRILITVRVGIQKRRGADRKSTRLNSSHTVISYAVFCLKKKKQIESPRANPRPHHPPLGVSQHGRAVGDG